MAEVFLKNVTKIFDKRVVAVDNMTLDVQDKEFVVLVGPSGCGKSTTLRMIAGLEEVTEGEIYIDGKLVNDVPPKDRDVAMVFQNYALYPHMTVYDNMAFGLKLRKFPKKEIQRRVHQAAEILGITHLLDRKPKALSGGERQRVAVGRAIVRKPKVFLFDEPLSNLDAKLRVQMRAELSKLHRQLEATIIYVTHDQVEAMTMGDRIVVMKDGRVHQIDTPLNLYDHPSDKFVASFIGSPSMNFIPGKVTAESNSLWFDEGTMRLRIPDHFKDRLKNYIGKEILLGIRPEDIHKANSTKRAKHLAVIKALVEVVEPIGREIFLYFTVGGNSIIARLDTRYEPRVGSELTLAFNMNKAHFFDINTEKAL